MSLRSVASRLLTTRLATAMLVVAPLALMGACRGQDAAEPGTVVMQFYTMRDALGVNGAPTRKELEALRPFVADTLAALLTAADAQRSDDLQRHPDEKPRYVEGDLFSSLFEGTTAVRPLVPLTDDTGAVRVPVQFTYDREKPSVTWTDTVVVVKERGHWVVRDVRYGGTWDFANKGALLESLASTR